MNISPTIIVVFIVLVLVINIIVWLWNMDHTCSVCKNICRNKNELSKCDVCKKQFCTAKSNKYEKVRVTIQTQLKGKLEIKYDFDHIYNKDTSCGTICIETDENGSNFVCHCQKHLITKK
jgi:hypothetical protein